jgi:hypothetical protein
MTLPHYKFTNEDTDLAGTVTDIMGAFYPKLEWFADHTEAGRAFMFIQQVGGEGTCWEVCQHPLADGWLLTFHHRGPHPVAYIVGSMADALRVLLERCQEYLGMIQECITGVLKPASSHPAEWGGNKEWVLGGVS